MGRGLGEDSKEGLLGNATKQHVPVTTEGSRLEANRAFFIFLNLAWRTKWLQCITGHLNLHKGCLHL